MPMSASTSACARSLPGLRLGLLLGLCSLLAAPLVASAPSLAQALAPREPQEAKQVRKELPSPEQIAALPADGGQEFNRLVFEQSPYLLQHARNPVDWYPWGEQAFRAAKEQDKPIFLSVGYSTCHWCHVMEHESFEDEEVAALLNASYICIKVDREERPDVDEIYMRVTQAMTGRGGWPNTVVLTPDRRPFFAGTYFPKRGQHGRMGLMDIAKALADAWRDDRQRVLVAAQDATRVLAQNIGGAAGDALEAEVMTRAYEQLHGSFDQANPGFGSAPKFPIPHNLRFLLRYHVRTGDARALEMVELTLHAMRRGGIWDHLGHGFHRYSTDARWFLPHFEKMLYDQALMAMAYLETYQVTGDEFYASTAREILDYVQRDMRAPSGGFYSAEDADSEGVEGLFYLWTPEQLVEALGEEDGALAARWYGVVEGGNFAEEAGAENPGRSLLYQPATLEQLAEASGAPLAELPARLESIRARLFALREPRVHPLKDDKILTDWNGLMIAAFSLAARALDEREYEAVARAAADHLLGELRSADGRLYKLSRLGVPSQQGMVEDYSFAIWGLFELYQSSFDERYLAAALELQRSQLAHFWDAARGGFYISPDDGEELILRPKEAYDGAIPSGNSVAAYNLLRLARASGATQFEERSDELMKAFSGGIGQSPVNYTQMMLALDFAVGPTHELVVAAGEDAADFERVLRALGRAFSPGLVVLARPAGEEPAIARLAPFVAEQTARDGETTLYLCQDFACQAPTHDLEAVLEQLGQQPKK